MKESPLLDLDEEGECKRRVFVEIVECLNNVESV